jgi:hypothetical protein
VTRQPMTPLVADTAKAQALAEWQARFERSPGGWVCPACKTVEPNEFLLGNNHGYHPGQPSRAPYGAEFGATCTKLELQRNHRIYDERMAMIRHLIDAGLDDGQISVRIGGMWPASMIARDRAGFAKEARLAARAAKGETVTVGHGSGCPCAYCEGPCGCPSCTSFRHGEAPSSEVAKQEDPPLALWCWCQAVQPHTSTSARLRGPTRLVLFLRKVGNVIMYVRAFRKKAPVQFYLAIFLIGMLIGDLISMAFS